LVERDAQGDDAQPGVYPDRLPRELVETLDHLQVGHGQGLLGGRPRAEPGQKYGTKQAWAVVAQQLAERLALPGARPLTEPSLGLELRRVGQSARGWRLGWPIG
jgi:hypothetical protein